MVNESRFVPKICSTRMLSLDVTGLCFHVHVVRICKFEELEIVREAWRTYDSSKLEPDPCEIFRAACDSLGVAVCDLLEQRKSNEMGPWY